MSEVTTREAASRGEYDNKPTNFVTFFELMFCVYCV